MKHIYDKSLTHHALELFPHLAFVVQDGSEDVLAQAEALLTDDVRDRISFYVRQIKLLRTAATQGCGSLPHPAVHAQLDRPRRRHYAQIRGSWAGGLSNDTPLLITCNDVVLPEKGTVRRYWEREMRQADLVMMVRFGAKQRTQAEFDGLLKEADPRYEICKPGA